MLSSSDAKWRCLWHLLVWSLLLMLFLSAGVNLSKHVPMMMLAAVAFVLLPIITALYSNTSGKHGAGLLRAAYVLCDPVLACISELPVTLISQLPLLLQKQACLTQFSECQNLTMACLHNLTLKHKKLNENMQEYISNDVLERQLDMQFLIMECSMVVPIVLSLLMGKRTRKMSYQTYIITFAYWFVGAIEAASLLDVSRRAARYQHIICTVETMLSIVMTVTNSYAVVTLCSYIVPSGAVYSGEVSQRSIRKFGFIYGSLVAAAGILFVESPLFIAKIQMIGNSQGALFPGAFYIWLLKDLVFSGLLVFWTLQRLLLKRKNSQLLCKPPIFDNNGVFFQPEKRDHYIQQNRRSYESSLESAAESDGGDNKDRAKDADDRPSKKNKSVRFKFDLGKAGFSSANPKDKD